MSSHLNPPEAICYAAEAEKKEQENKQIYGC